MAGPLAGIRVIDLSTMVSEPLSTALLADQGAELIKVEPSGGDIARRTAGNGGFTAGFVSCNRGKRSLALELKQSAAVELLRRLITSADVLVQNSKNCSLRINSTAWSSIRARSSRMSAGV